MEETLREVREGIVDRINSDENYRENTRLTLKSETKTAFLILFDLFYDGYINILKS